MQGGITSGVIYPNVVVELAKQFQFKNIGGASAGAIAAAAAAAAELGRIRNAGGSFALLSQLPTFLVEVPRAEKRTRLFGFFQPQDGTRRVFQTCVAALGGGAAGAFRALVAAILNFWMASIAGTLPGILLFWDIHRSASRPSSGFALAIALVGAFLGTLIAFVVSIARQLPRNFFGLTSGMPGSGKAQFEALTPWLVHYLNELAGMDPHGRPLTFGDLWGESQADPLINLEMMTTCLTHGRPYRLPFRDDGIVKDNRQFFYRRDEFERLFPSSIIDWMMERPRPADGAEEIEREREFLSAGFIPLPAPKDLPVVVAVRMSLSFPILLSAVPLYAVDYSRKKKEDQRPVRCWFSDGGISSNFPVHFFDSAFPRWPTFGIDLAEKHPDYPAGLYMPDTNSSGTTVKWRRERPAIAGITQIGDFLASIVVTAKDWSDDIQCRLPGFRDRIAQVSLEHGDGGLNLTMTEDRITRLSSYGTDAGKELALRFTTGKSDCKLDWRNHRRVRLRSAMAAAEEWLHRLETGCAQAESGDVPYGESIRDPNPPSYPWANESQTTAAAQTLAQLEEAAKNLSDPLSALQVGAPRPRPEIRTHPRI